MIERPPPTLYVRFTITGDFDPEAVSQATGLVPANSWCRGDRIARGRRIAPHDRWSYGIGPIEASDVAPHLSSLLELVFPWAGYLTEFRRSHTVSFVVTVSIWTPEHPLSYAPIMFIEPQLLSQISSLGASFEIDLNLLSDDPVEPV